MSSTTSSLISPDLFSHLRIIEGMFVSLSMSRILTTIAHYIQFPKIHKPNALHLAWLFTLMILIVNWWWNLFTSSATADSTYQFYFFSILTPVCFYFLAALLSPGFAVEKEGFHEYFLNIRGWFYAFIILSMLTDPIDVYLTIESETFGFVDLSFYAKLFVIGLVALLFLSTMRSRSYKIQRNVALSALLLTLLLLAADIFS